MSETFEIIAQSRSDSGKGASRRLRRLGLVPGIVYGGSEEPTMISMVHSDLLLHLENEAFYSHLLQLKLDGQKPERVILKDLQRHPAKPFILHLDLQRVVKGEKMNFTVPVHFVNEEAAPGIKTHGGLLMRQVTELEISCLPRHLPEAIVVDLAGMEVGDSVMLSGIQLPEGVELVGHGEDADDQTLAAISHAQMADVTGDEAQAGEAGVEEAGEEPAED